MRPRLRRGLWIASIAVLCSGAGGAAAFGPTVRAQISRHAERRGLVALVGTVRPGWGRVWLRDVRVSIPEVPGVSAQLDAVEVDLSAGLEVRNVTVHGGRLDLDGTPRDLLDRLNRWRQQRPAAVGKGSAVTYAAHGIRATWRNVDPAAPDQDIWGLSYQRDQNGREVISADLARAAIGSVRLELHGPELTLRREAGARVLERLIADSVEATLDLDSLPVGFEAETPPPAGSGAASAASSASASPLPGAARESSPTRTAQRPEEGRGPWLRRLIRDAAGAVATVLPDGSELDLGGLRMDLAHTDQHLRLGPGRLRVSRTSSDLRVSLRPGAQPQSTPLTMEVRTPLGDGRVELAVTGGPVSLAELGIQQGDMGLREVQNAEVEASLGFGLSPDGRQFSFSGHGSLARLSLKQAWLARQPLRAIRLAWKGSGAADSDGSRLRIDDGQLELGSIRFQLSGEVERSDTHSVARVEASIPLASCQDMLDSIPHGLAPLLSGMRMNGTFSLDSKVQFDSRRPGATVVHVNASNECRVTGIPPAIDPRQFRGVWTRRVLAADGREASIESGPGTDTWVPGHAISHHMETAVLVCEDARFWRHHGFDYEAIENSIRDNLRAGRFVRGASTISMQLAKNLYLPREKTVSRKLQEAVLTILLEQELSKAELLELYLNVIEFGPGVYGIGPAARYYFDTAASSLSLGQSLYLASILPRPSQHHFGADGQVTPRWSDYLRRLMQIAYKIRRITDEELQDGLREQVAFRVPPVASSFADPQDGSQVDTDHAAPDNGLPEPPPPGL